jgi:hypothetical protein
MIKLISITILTVVAVFFCIACSSKSESDAGLPVIFTPDLANHPIYSDYNFGENESMIDIGTLVSGLEMVNSKYQDIWNTYSESPFPTLILSKSCLISAPGMDGYEVCRRLKEDQSTLDILTA